jgi:excisionase family DNA binding protein
MTLLNKKQAAAMLNMSPKTLELWQRTRRISFYKIGSSVRYDESELLALLAKSYVPAMPHEEKGTA